MGDEVDPGLPGAGASAAGARGLEERVAWLEVELAALRRQVAAGTATPMAQAAETRRAAAPPPPPPMPRPMAAGGGAGADGGAETGEMRRLVSEWRAGRAEASDGAVERVGEARDSFEERLGSQVFNRIAILLLLTGTAYFLKLAVDRQWIGPVGRVLIGLVAGAGLVLWSERFRKKGFAAFSYSLKALGSGVLYLSLWAAFHLYHLMPAGAALGLMVLVTAWNGYMAWAQDAELLAAYALSGGFATPLLLSTGGDHEVFLFTYLLAMDVATVALVRLRGWAKLLLGAFPLTVAFFAAWYVEHYAADALAATAIYIVLFSVTFGSVALGRERAGGDGELRRATLLKEILLPLANAAFAALAGYRMLQDGGHHAWLPWLMLALSAVYLAVMRAPQTRTAAAVHLSLAVVLLTIAIPLKASGHWITVSWLVEGLALLWVSARLGSAEDEAGEVSAARTLRVLASGTLLLGFCGIAAHFFASGFATLATVWTADTATELTGVAVFAGVVWVGLRAAGGAGGRDASWVQVGFCGLLAIVAIALLMAVREVGTSWVVDTDAAAHVPLQSADFWMAMMGLGIFAGAVTVSLRVAREHDGEDFWMVCAAMSTIAFNLIAVLTGVREIAAVWEQGAGAAAADAGLQEALAISAYLMLYGAALLAVGFWRRSGFLRWQALALLAFTIGKAFLYDMRSLSQGYRVVSLLGLGALLLAISFAYQKDWLGLRAPSSGDAGPGAEPGRDAGHEAPR
ncbi:MAG: DUF2339 domain-containing protein [Acidobacteriaceae bacterium]|jgi:uncharacterized membrane protein